MSTVAPVATDEVRVQPLPRVFAKFIDLFIVMILAALIYPIGPLIGFLYSIFADALPLKGFSGQSFGKKVFKLKVVSTKLGDPPIRWRDSIFRNAPVGVATFFGLIPVWGWAILALIGFPLMIIEIYLLVKAPRGQRLGDVMADTRVVRA